MNMNSTITSLGWYILKTVLDFLGFNYDQAF